MRVLEELDVLGRVYAQDRTEAERPGRGGLTERGVRDRAEDPVDPFGNLGRVDEAPRVEERIAGMVRPVRVGGDDQHPEAVARH